MQPQSVVFQQPRLGQVPEDELRKTGNPWRYAAGRARRPARLRLHHPRRRVARAAAAAGSASAGEVRRRPRRHPGRCWPASARCRWPSSATTRRRRGRSAYAPAADRAAAGRRPPQGFPVTLTYEGKGTPFLQMEPEPDKNEQRWAEFPRHYWGVVGKVKPGATPLAYVADGDTRSPDKKDEAERAQEARPDRAAKLRLRPRPFVGIDSTWRWRYRTGDTYHHRFWGQAIRWAASDKPLVTGNEFVRFGTRDAVYRHGQDIDLVVRWPRRRGSWDRTPWPPLRVLRLKDGKGADGGEESVALVPLGRREARAARAGGQGARSAGRPLRRGTGHPRPGRQAQRAGRGRSTRQEAARHLQRDAAGRRGDGRVGDELPD